MLRRKDDVVTFLSADDDGDWHTTQVRVHKDFQVEVKARTPQKSKAMAKRLVKKLVKWEKQNARLQKRK